MPLSEGDLEKLAKIIETSHDKAVAYTKVIIGLGYAALFAVWSGTKEDLTQGQRLATAFFALLSLVAYVVYEIWQMIVISRRALNFPKLVEKHSGDLAATLADYGEIEKKHLRKFNFWWRVALWFTIPTGVTAGVVLMYAFLVRLLA